MSQLWGGGKGNECKDKLRGEKRAMGSKSVDLGSCLSSV